MSRLIQLCRVQAAATGPIAIPKVRIIDDYHLNQQAADHHGPMISGNIAAAPYLRHQQPGVYDEHQQAEYVVDDEDLAWLNSSNTKVRSIALVARQV